MAHTILYLTPSSRLLGARRSLLQLVTNLDPERYRPVVVAQGPGDLVDALRDAGVKVHLLFMGWWRKGIYWPLIPFKTLQLASIARRENAALIHCNEFHSNPYAILASRISRHLYRKSLPVISHMRLSITPRQIDKYLLRRADRILAVSEAAARDFDVWPDRRKRVEVVYNGVDLEQFHARIDSAEARQRLGLPTDAFVVGQFALLSPRKQQHLLVDAIAHAAARAPNLRALIVGSAGRTELDYERGLKQSVVDKGLSEIVRFIPFTPDVVDLYAACDVNILISRDEGFGRTIIEAGALSIPSIATQIGGMPELIEDPSSGAGDHPANIGIGDVATGRLIPGNATSSTLAQCLVDLAQNPEAARRMGKRARIFVEKRFTIARHVQHTMDIYDRILSSKA